MGTEKTYYLGLDMGTNSLGWAVTDQNYYILRSKGKDLWGVRLFDEANTSVECRNFRVSRRRRQREVARIGVLRELFSDEIEKVDPGFFLRLDESKFFVEDRSEDNKQKYGLFADKLFSDVEYYAKYPTVFHLRKELIKSSEPHDVRLVFLALVNMFKHRGHFLNNSLGIDGKNDSIGEAYHTFVETAKEMEVEFPEKLSDECLEEILSSSDSRKKKSECLFAKLGLNKKQKREVQLVNLMCGLKGKLSDLFPYKEYDEEHKKLAFSFQDSDYEEKEIMLQEILDDDEMELIQAVKEIYDSGMLAGIMKGYSYLSMARVASYEKHKADLKILKSVLKKYNAKEYFEMFRNETAKAGSYSAYVGSVNYHGTYRRGLEGGKQEDLYKRIKKTVEKFPQDDAEVSYILSEMEKENFLPKQLTASNGVIPNQVHAREMKAILQQAEQYLPFLQEKDERGLSVSDKILQLFMFQIPYYVGPLGQQYKDKKGYNVWAERKESGKVYPWNFTEKIDMKQSAEKFIQRMVRHCTYLSGETALPKQSLLYEKYQVLNELNNLRIRGERISVSLKQELYHELFETGKKVSMNRLTNYLIQNGIITKEEKEIAISGIDGGFQNSLSSLGKFKGVFGDAVYSDEYKKMMEDIIFWGTVYGDGRKLLKEKVEETYGTQLSDAQKKRIYGFKFSGWGRLSKEFLTMSGASKEDGEIKGLIQAMWDTNCNLMELLSDRFTYRDTLDEMVETAEKPLSEWTIEDLDEMYLSAPVKRMVWQTIRVVEELQQVLGCPPKRIFVEMTRSDGEKGKRTVSRQKKLLELYKALGKEGKSWSEELSGTSDSQLRIKKLYLYYLQMGKCMYTGENIKLDQLMNDNLYDIDHIYPRHFVKDDNIGNNLVLVKKEKNAHKSDSFPIENEIRTKMMPYWKMLREKGFMTEEKYNRLTRKTAFSDEEKAAFISRQLVETSQGTKAITNIFKQAFSNSEIVFSKASVVSDFRKKFNCYKVRCVNNYHHAHDAYLNIVVGNTYRVKFTINPLNFVKEAKKNPDSDENRYNMDRIFTWSVRRNGEEAWIAQTRENPGTIQTVKKYLGKNSPLMTKMAHEKHGGLTQKATIWSAKKAASGNTDAYIPVKMNDARLADVTKYGGVTSIAVAGYTLVECEVAGKMVRSLEALPIYLGGSDNLTEEQMVEYFTKTLQLENKKKQVTNVRICKKMIPSDSLIKYNGFYYYLAGKTGNQIVIISAVQLCLSAEQMLYAKKIEKACVSGYFEEKDKHGKVIISKEKNQKMYDLFIKKYKDSIFSKKNGAIGNTIINGRTVFMEISVENQCKVLQQVFLNFQSGIGVDLTTIGGSNRSGVTCLNKKVSNAEELKLIDQSVTGIFSREINLLTI